MRESWLDRGPLVDAAALRRRYWEVVTIDGRDLVVFRDLVGGRVVPAALSRLARAAPQSGCCPVTPSPRRCRCARQRGQSTVEYLRAGPARWSPCSPPAPGLAATGIAGSLVAQMRARAVPGLGAGCLASRRAALRRRPSATPRRRRALRLAVLRLRGGRTRDPRAAVRRQRAGDPPRPRRGRGRGSGSGRRRDRGVGVAAGSTARSSCAAAGAQLESSRRRAADALLRRLAPRPGGGAARCRPRRAARARRAEPDVVFGERGLDTAVAGRLGRARAHARRRGRARDAHRPAHGGAHAPRAPAQRPPRRARPGRAARRRGRRRGARSAAALVIDARGRPLDSSSRVAPRCRPGRGCPGRCAAPSPAAGCRCAAGASWRPSATSTSPTREPRRRGRLRARAARPGLRLGPAVAVTDGAAPAARRGGAARARVYALDGATAARTAGWTSARRSAAATSTRSSGCGSWRRRSASRAALARARGLPGGGLNRAGGPLPAYANIRSCRTPSSTATRPSPSWTGPRCPRSWWRRRWSAGTRRSRLTDHDTVSGSMEFAQAARQLGLRAIHGAEVRSSITPARRRGRPAPDAARARRAGLGEPLPAAHARARAHARDRRARARSARRR